RLWLLARLGEAGARVSLRRLAGKLAKLPVSLSERIEAASAAADRSVPRALQQVTDRGWHAPLAAPWCDGATDNAFVQMRPLFQNDSGVVRSDHQVRLFRNGFQHIAQRHTLRIERQHR